MRFHILPLVICLGTSIPNVYGFGDEEVNAALRRLNAAGGGQDTATAAQLLANFGEKALPLLCDVATRHQDAGVRRACYEVLIADFVNRESVQATLSKRGLRDEDERTRYICAFSLGQHKVYAAFRQLRMVIKISSTDELTRLTAAKWLAQLGDADVLPQLYRGLGNDAYMQRYVANLGIKALSGKNLNDFDGYDYAEGAFVSGGLEAVICVDTIITAERKAKRFAAIASFCKWLKKERPELYMHLAPGY